MKPTAIYVNGNIDLISLICDHAEKLGFILTCAFKTKAEFLEFCKSCPNSLTHIVLVDRFYSWCTCSDPAFYEMVSIADFLADTKSIKKEIRFEEAGRTIVVNKQEVRFYHTTYGSLAFSLSRKTLDKINEKIKELS